MSAEHEPDWKLLKCEECASLCKFDTLSPAIPTCPTCGSKLAHQGAEESTPQPSSDAEVISHRPAAPSPVAHPPTPQISAPLITELGRGEPTDPQLDPALLKRTTQEELYSDPEKRVRVKRSSKRVEKQLTDWDSVPEAASGESVSRRERRVPTWQKFLKIAATALVPVALLILIVYGLIAANQEKVAPAREGEEVTPATIARKALTPLEAATLDRDLSREIFTRSREISEKFLGAQTWEDRLHFVRDAIRVRPLMEEFYARPENNDGPIPFRPIKQIAKTPVHQTLILLQVESEDFETFPIAIERDADDNYRVDWESFVGYGKHTWSGMMEKRPTEPFLLRARVMQRPYYNYGFQDNTHISWQLEDRKGNHRVYGYVTRRGSLHMELGRAASSGNPTYMLLRVRYPEGASADNQLEILEYVAQGWVAPAGSNQY